MEIDIMPDYEFKMRVLAGDIVNQLRLSNLSDESINQLLKILVDALARNITYGE